MKEFESTNHPEDWGSVLLGDLIEKNRTIRYGVVQPGSFDPNGRILVRGQDYSFGWASPEKFFRVSSFIEERYRNARLKPGDLLLTIVGEPGIMEIVPDWLDGANITQTTARIPIDVTKASPLYVKYFLQGDFGKRLISKYVKGNAQQGLNIRDVRIFKIITPPLEEQKAIAQVLSDFDNLIDGLERLIAKKRSIKEGVMQELLRPKEGWEIKKLGEVAEMYSGGTPLTSVPSYYYGDIPWVVIADITKSGKYISKTEKTISQAGLANSSAKLFKNGVLLFAMYASIGKSTIALMETTCNQAILGIEPKLIDREYLYYVLSFNEKKFIAFGQTGTQSNLSKEMVQKLEIPIPKSVEEQIQIATILSQIDLEIATLVSKLEKYNQLRLGVARQLLTGKTRLV